MLPVLCVAKDMEDQAACTLETSSEAEKAACSPEFLRQATTAAPKLELQFLSVSEGLRVQAVHLTRITID